MRLDSSPAVRIVIAAAAVLPGMVAATASAQAPAPAPAQTIDGQLFARGMELFQQNNYADAVKSFETIPQQVPTSPLIPQATFQIGYIAYLTGNYDKSVEVFEKVPSLKNVPPEVAELAAQLIPQVSLAKAGKLPPEDPGRRGAFEDAIRQYDQFIQKYPQSAEVESANYGKATAMYQISNYEGAVAALRMNLQRFANSPSILDSQFLLAISLSNVAAQALEKATAKDPTVETNYAEAEKILNDIISKARNDYAVANDARFQIGEISFARAGLAPKEQKAALFQKALDNYRVVVSKDLVVAAQKQRIEQFRQAEFNALRQQDFNTRNRLQRLGMKERDKLVQFETRPDQTLAAKLQSAKIFFQQGKLDESRALLNVLKNLTDDAEAKKQIAYFTAMSLAAQTGDAHGKVAKLNERAEEAYKSFRDQYPKDKIGENLAIVLGAGFVDEDPDKAIKYLQESLTDYPNGRFATEALTQQAAALVKLQRFDDAAKLYQETLSKSKNKEVSAACEFGLADIARQTNKAAEAIAGFKKVRDTYSETLQAPSAAYYVGQLMLENGDAKGAITELTAYLKKYPDHAMVPEATFGLGNAQDQAGQKDAALATLKEVSTKFPESRVSPFAFFKRADMLNKDGKQDDAVQVMKEFIAKNPEREDALFQAYDFIAQVHSAQGKGDEAMAAYNEFVSKNAQNPAAPQALLKVSALQKAIADSLGARYVALPKDKQTIWTTNIDESVKTAERVVNEYPDSEQVALALKAILDCQKLRREAKLITEEDVQNYFQGLAKKFEGKPATRSKVIFTLASYTFDKDKPKAIQQMASVYDASQRYAPYDLDLYGQALIDEGKLDEAEKLFTKLAADYEIPKNTEPKNAPKTVQEAQSVAIFGIGKIRQKQNKIDDAKAKFDQLETLYGWSPKMAEANYGIALGLVKDKDYPAAVKRLLGVLNNSKTAAELRASAMLLFAKVNEEQGNHSAAIDNYVKVAALYGGVPEAAAEGLFKGAQLLERQAKGELPMPTPTLASKKAVEAKNTKPGGDPKQKTAASPAPKTAAK